MIADQLILLKVPIVRKRNLSIRCNLNSKDVVDIMQTAEEAKHSATSFKGGDVENVGEEVYHECFSFRSISYEAILYFSGRSYLLLQWGLL